MYKEILKYRTKNYNLLNIQGLISLDYNMNFGIQPNNYMLLVCIKKTAVCNITPINLNVFLICKGIIMYIFLFCDF